MLIIFFNHFQILSMNPPVPSNEDSVLLLV